MGMDVYGKSPTCDVGAFFRNNIWYWHPLWSYCERIAPDLIPSDNSGHSNEGWGLSKDKTRKLAERLERDINSGKVAEYSSRFAEYQAQLPLEPCRICDATGKRATPPNVGPGDHPCNACSGKGRVEQIEARYSFSQENVEEFVDFLKACGGFNIY